MTNFQIYRKTLSFSFVRFLIDMGAFLLMGGITVGGLFLGNAINKEVGAIIGIIVGLILGIIAMSLITFFISNRYKAAQIAMMVKAVDEGKLPDHPYKEGKAIVKSRFKSIALFFFITNAIKSVFKQLGRTMTGIAGAVGGEVGGSIGSAVDSAVQTLIAYLCDCCLGWVFFRSEENAAKAALEGAAIFFKRGKTLLRNVGRIFGMGFLSLLLIGGAFTGIFYLVAIQFPTQLNQLMTMLADERIVDYHVLGIILAAIGGLIMWGIIHTVLIRPFILTGVLKNFIIAGKENRPTEADMAEVTKRAPKVAKLQEKME